MDRSRRALLLGGTLTFLAPSRLYAQPDLGREHRPMIDSPTLVEDPSAVPLQVSVNHPMEPEHFIRSIEIRLDHDPVRYKSKFLFTPANGQAAVRVPHALGGWRRPQSHGRVLATRALRHDQGDPGDGRRVRRATRHDPRPSRQAAGPSAGGGQVRDVPGRPGSGSVSWRPRP